MNVTQSERVRIKLGMPNRLRGVKLTRQRVVLALGWWLLAAVCAATQAQFLYTNINNQITITRYTGPTGSITVPSTIDALPVVAIAPKAFQNTPPSSVTIPDSVLTIGDEAFALDFALTNVVMGKGLVTLGKNVFTQSYGLQAIAVDPGNPNFSSAGGVLFDKAQKNLLWYPPRKPDSSYTIPDSVTNIAYGILSGALLEAIHVGPANTAYSSSDGVLFNKTQTLLIQYPVEKSDWEYVISNTVTRIGPGAFAASFVRRVQGLSVLLVDDSAFEDSELEEARFGEVQWFGTYAFNHCQYLKTVSSGSSLTVLGAHAFALCTSLTELPIHNGVEAIQEHAFFGCTALTNIVLPETLTEIGDFAFFACTNLTNVVFGSRVESIGVWGFEECSLTMIGLPKTLRTLGAGAFENMPGLKRMYFEGDAPSATYNPFSDDEQVVIYYLRGATGWPGLFWNRPTVEFFPQLSATRLGSTFILNVNAASNSPIVVEQSVNLSSGGWTTLANLTTDEAGKASLTAPASGEAARFFRFHPN